ncbi:hypothetical protein COO60DRAFT_708863 [Scenedesmus sp. NREL 46B-D3]|nr:hypothetical protein COO60DRAFT_708863 [Scenedesmus sp. NREL 46B-D3]
MCEELSLLCAEQVWFIIFASWTRRCLLMVVVQAMCCCAHGRCVDAIHQAVRYFGDCRGPPSASVSSAGASCYTSCVRCGCLDVVSTSAWAENQH